MKKKNVILDSRVGLKYNCPNCGKECVALRCRLVYYKNYTTMRYAFWCDDCGGDDFYVEKKV